MLKRSAWISIFSALLAIGLAPAMLTATESMAIIYPQSPSFAEKLAAKEIGG